MKRRHTLTASIFSTAILLAAAHRTDAASFSISNANTAAQTLAAGQAGVITATGSLTLGGTVVPITITGSSTITNSGQIIQTGTGRGILNAAGTLSLTITNNAGALIRTADADTIRITPATTGGATLDNYGTISSLNASKGGSQAVDWSNITSGSNVITNYSTGLILSSDADSVRPGTNGVVNNYGTIRSTVTTDTGSDAIDGQANTGITLNNFSTGLVDSSRHGITAGTAIAAVAFTTTINNSAGGIIRGNNGSGINLDGLNALHTATIVNGGTITGNGVTGDGDGVDVDGLVNITNTGIIRSVNAFSATVVANSEGITVGGGTIVNSGTIEGLVTAGNTNAVGKGISLVGNDITTGPLAGTREAIYGNAVITNQNGGLIRGDSDSGIVVSGPASGFTVTINNNAGATIRGGATLAGLGGTNAAILTGADNDTINTGGTIDGSSNGRAIAMGAGNNTLNITGGTITGSIDGGTGGTNALTINPGAGNAFSYSGAITNFNTTAVQGGRFNLGGSINSTSAISISSGGTFNYTGSGALANSITVNGGEFKSNGGNFTGTLTLASGTVSGTNLSGVALNIGAGVMLSPGNSPGTMSTGSETWAGGGSYLWEINRLAADGGTQGADPGWDFADITGTLSITASAGNKFHINVDSLGLLTSWNNSQSYTFHLATASGGITGFDASDFLIDTSAFADLHSLGSGSFYVAQNGNSLELDFTPVPEPATVGIGIALIGVAFIRRRRGA